MKPPVGLIGRAWTPTKGARQTKHGGLVLELEIIAGVVSTEGKRSKLKRIIIKVNI